MMFLTILKLALIAFSCVLPILCDHYYEDANTGGTACFGYITGNYEYTPGLLPQPRQCDPNEGDYSDGSYYNHKNSPAAYRDSSCCTNKGAYSIVKRNNNVFFNSWTIDPAWQCMAQSEMMRLMVCNPDQGLYVEETQTGFDMSNSLRVCLSTCQKWFDTCGLPGQSFPGWLNYTDAKSMCERLWQGPGEEACNDDNFACESQLGISVVDEGLCLSAEDPSEELLLYYEDEYADYPNGCGESGDSKKTLIMIGIIIGSIVGCVCLAGGLCVFYYMCTKNSDDVIKSPSIYHFEKEPTRALTEAEIVMTSISHGSAERALMEENIAVSRSIHPEPSAPPLSPIHVPVQTSSFQLPVTNRFNPDFKNRGHKASFSISSPKVDENAVEVAIPEPEPELNFIQKLDLRELEDQKSMGMINVDNYEKRKNKILYEA